jgi:hypothetical protein
LAYFIYEKPNCPVFGANANAEVSPGTKGKTIEPETATDHEQEQTESIERRLEREKLCND